MVLKFQGESGHALRAPDSLVDAAIRLGALHRPVAPRQATLPGAASNYARRPASARPAARLQTGAGTAATRHRLRRFLSVACRQGALAARPCPRRCRLSFARFSQTPWLFLQKSAPVLPSLLGVSIKDAALHYVSCLARLLQTLPAHSVHARGRHLTGQELSKKR